jgi:heme exporter protein A
MYKLEVENLFRSFGPRRVLRDISFSLQTGDSLAVIGRNGSGKSTLLHILAGLTAPTRGKITFSCNDEKIDRREAKKRLSYVGPELTLYDSLTAIENLEFFATMRGISLDQALIQKILDMVGLEGRGDDYYRGYSSGMKQRLKYATALLNDPDYLLLDEPTSNLDEEGKKIVSQVITRQKENGILIIATNEKEEYDFARKRYRLDG